MGSMQNIKEEAEHYGFKKKTAPGTHRVTWQISCAYCPATEEHGWGPTTSPALMVRNMRTAGWLIDRNKWPKCGACRKSDRDKFVANHPDGPPVKAPKPVAPVPHLTLVEEVFGRKSLADVKADPKATRAIYAKLEAMFDDAKSEYREGWSDARIAEEVECSPEAVAHIRVESYGKIKRKVDLVGVIDEIEFIRLYAEDQIAMLKAEVARRVDLIEKRVFE